MPSANLARFAHRFLSLGRIAIACLRLCRVRGLAWPARPIASPTHPTSSNRPCATLALVGLLALAGCASTGPAGAEGTTEADGPPNILLDPTHPDLNRTTPDTFKVLFETSAGDFVVEVYADWAPRGAERFYNLVQAGYYDGVRFFRVIPGFMAQFGISPDPEITSAWREARIEDDPVQVTNERGTITFAAAGPDTRTVQLFINLVDNGRLDASGFSPFGRVTGGMDSVDRIYGGYGEGAPRGDGPPQDRVRSEGEDFLAEAFPRLDRIERARVIDP